MQWHRSPFALKNSTLPAPGPQRRGHIFRLLRSQPYPMASLITHKILYGKQTFCSARKPGKEHSPLQAHYPLLGEQRLLREVRRPWDGTLLPRPAQHQISRYWTSTRWHIWTVRRLLVPFVFQREGNLRRGRPYNSVFHHHAAHSRIWKRFSQSKLRQVKCMPHESSITVCHATCGQRHSSNQSYCFPCEATTCWRTFYVTCGGHTHIRMTYGSPVLSGNMHQHWTTRNAEFPHTRTDELCENGPVFGTMHFNWPPMAVAR
jgi:hypothetical protein